MKHNLFGKSILLAMAVSLSGVAFADRDHEQHRGDRDHARSRAAITVTHGVAAGDITATSAVIWSRANQAGYMHVRVKGMDDQPRAVQVTPGSDFTGKIKITGLHAGRDYRYQVWFSARKDTHRPYRAPIAEGVFHTAPRERYNQSFRFAWGGDVSGQNVCRDINKGLPIFRTIQQSAPDFFIGLGDMIYADGTCAATGRYGNQQVPGDFTASFDLKNYWAHWRYNRDDASFQHLLATTPYYAIWDDHEVVNDFGPLHDTRNYAPYTAGKHLLPKGMQAFLNYNPVAESASTPDRLYRKIRWGKQLEVFILDNRQYRDANGESDDESFKKTMLGREQLTWLKESLKESNATWKFVVTTVPMSIPTGYPAANGRDGWANYDQTTGYEYELADILATMQQGGMKNIVFITTDVHFGEVFRYTPFTEDPAFQVTEYVSGPLNAGLFPNRKFDTTLGTESLFFYGPSGPVNDYETALTWMNFGTASIDKQGILTVKLIDANGREVYSDVHVPR